MNVISKNVVMGLLFSFAFLPILSCSLDFLPETGETGSVDVSIKIPSTGGASSPLPSVLKEAFAPDASARFLHPYTRLVTVSVSTNDPKKPIAASAAVAEDSGFISISVPKVPIGRRSVTVSLYDGSEALLARGEQTVAVSSRRSAAAAISAVPVLYETMVPGPYSPGSRGAEIGSAASGAFLVYRVELPAAGAYALRYRFNDEVPIEGAALYDSQGRPVETSAGGYESAAYQAAALQPGPCYIAATVPTLAAEDIVACSLDADLKVTVSARSILSPDGVRLMDRMEAVSFRVACGFDPVPYYGVETYGSAQGSSFPSGATKAVPDSFTFRISPNEKDSDLIRSMNTDPSGGSVTFTDALLGIQRTGVPFTLPAQPRTFVYCNASATKPQDSFALARNDFYYAVQNEINALPAELGAPVLAISGDVTSLSATTISANRPIVMGGFTLDGTRTEGHGTSAVTFSTSVSALTINSAGTMLDGLRFGFANATITGNTSSITLNANASFANCVVQGSSISVSGVAGPAQYRMVHINNATGSFDRCSILGGPIVLAGTTMSNNANAITVAGASSLHITNSIVSAGTVTYAGLATQSVAGIYATNDSGTLDIVGSAVSGGMGAPPTIPAMRAIQMASTGAASLSLFNSALVAQNLTASGSALVSLGNLLSSATITRTAFGYGTGQSASVIVNYAGGGPITVSGWASSSLAAENYLSDLATFKYLSLDAASSDFLRPSAAGSADFMASGGWDLGPNGHPLTGGLAAFTNARLSLDREGRTRTGNGTYGFSVGAYEVD